MPHDEPSFLEVAILFLAAAVVFVPIASRFKLGSVLGYLIAGCVIGPFGFGFVRDVSTILHFAEIGVVLMLFVIGLELEPSRLVAMRSQVFRGGTIEMVAAAIPLALLLGVFGLPIRGSLVAGAALALSSTAIAVQSMKERGLLNSRTGRAAFGVLLFQDIAAIPIVGLVPLLATGGDAQGVSWTGAGKVVAAVLIVVVLGRFALRPALRVIASTSLRDIFTAFALLLVLGIAFVMERAGVSMALGAFLAGVLLAGSEYRHALETDIEPFKGLLMGLFFMGVGMSIDFGLVASKPLIVVALVLGFVVLKGAVLFAIARPLDVGGADRFGFAALLAQGSEFAFVVFGVARTARLLPGDWDRMLTLVVALSMAFTPLLLLANDLLLRATGNEEREMDAIESDDAPIIIAGFGRFGQIVARLLFASGLKATVLDFDPDQVELLRKFDFRVFYGDASRLDLLETAGARTAKVLVVAVDDVETSVRIVELVRQHFPSLAIVARARNVTHYIKLRSLGVEAVERELFEGSLHLGRSVLEKLGVGAHEARERADRFRRENINALERVFQGPMDEASRIAFAREAREQLERQMIDDMRRLEREHGHGWHLNPNAEDQARAE